MKEQKYINKKGETKTVNVKSIKDKYSSQINEKTGLLKGAKPQPGGSASKEPISSKGSQGQSR